jgi:hypothetical protein
MELKYYAMMETFRNLDRDTQAKLIGKMSLERYGVNTVTIPHLNLKYRSFAYFISEAINLTNFFLLFEKYEKFKEICTGGYSYYSDQGYGTWLFTNETTFSPYNWNKDEFLIDVDEIKITCTKENFFSKIEQRPITRTTIGLQHTTMSHENLTQNKNCIKLLDFLKL